MFDSAKHLFCLTTSGFNVSCVSFPLYFFSSSKPSPSMDPCGDDVPLLPTQEYNTVEESLGVDASDFNQLDEVVDRPQQPRIRLRSKQRAPAFDSAPCSPSSCQYLSIWHGIARESFETRTYRDRYWFVYNKYRWWTSLETHSNIAFLQRFPKLLELIRRVQREGLDMTQAAKREGVCLFLQESSAPDYVLEFGRAAWMTQSLAGKEFLHASTVLLTWQGDWGVLDVSLLEGARQKRMFARS